MEEEKNRLFIPSRGLWPIDTVIQVWLAGCRLEGIGRYLVNMVLKSNAD
jgi:hypothetical protein